MDPTKLLAWCLFVGCLSLISPKRTGPTTPPTVAASPSRLSTPARPVGHALHADAAPACAGQPDKQPVCGVRKHKAKESLHASH